MTATWQPLLLRLLAGMAVTAIANAAAQDAASADVSRAGDEASGTTAAEATAHEHVQYRQPEITAEQVARAAEHEKYVREHAGHEGMHAEMLMVLVGVLVATQISMILWKKHHPKSFHKCTLLGLWFIPVVVAWQSAFIRFVIVWTVFSVLNTFVMHQAFQQPLKNRTPRLVYKWFMIMHGASRSAGFVGWVLIVLELTCFPDNRLGGADLLSLGTTLLFYSFYFGVLVRDFAEFCSSRMATTLGFYNPHGMPLRSLPNNMCGLCGKDFADGTEKPGAIIFTPSATIADNDTLSDKRQFDTYLNGVPQPCVNPFMAHLRKCKQAVHDRSLLERTIKLECGHVFHEWCVRGWCLVGKKDICPFCKERVDLRSLSKSPWITVSLVHAGILDSLRYLIVWNPFMAIAFKLIVRFLNLR